MAQRGRMPLQGLPRGGLSPAQLLRVPPYGPPLPPLGPGQVAVPGQLMGAGSQAGGGPRAVEQKLLQQQSEMQRLMTENQRLAAAHVALRQDMAVASAEVGRLNAMLADKDGRGRMLAEQAAKMEADLRSLEPLRAELRQMGAELQAAQAHRAEVEGSRAAAAQQMQQMTQDMQRMHADLQHLAAAQQEAEQLRQDLEHARSALDYEKKAKEDHAAKQQGAEKSLADTARENEKLRAQLAEVEQKPGATTAPGGTGGYLGGYPGSEAGSAFPSSDYSQPAYAFLLAHQQQAAQGSAYVPQAAPVAAAAAKEQPPSEEPSGAAGAPAAAPPPPEPAADWSEHKGPDGKPFYFNKLTGVSQWELPPALAAAEAQKQQLDAQRAQAQATAQQALTTLYQQQQQQMMQQPGGQASQPSTGSAPPPFEQQQQQQPPPLGYPSFTYTPQPDPQGQRQQQQQQQQQPPPQLQQFYSPATLQHSMPVMSPQQQPFGRQPQPQQQQQQPQPQQQHYPAAGHFGVPASSPASSLPLPGHAPSPQAYSLPAAEVGNAMHRAGSAPSVSTPSFPPPTGPAGANLFVFGIPEDFNDQKLEALFAEFGRVLTARVGVDKDTGQSRGFGFVSMDSLRAADAAIAGVNGRIFSGRRIKVERKRGDSEQHRELGNGGSQYSQGPRQTDGPGPARWHNAHPSAGSSYRPY